MGTKKKFTPEELKHLQANPYTLRVTADSISYTHVTRQMQQKAAEKIGNFMAQVR